jgi:hypothetical protein
MNGSAWFLAGLFVMPLAILGHEAGHFLAKAVLGMSGIVLHYESTTHAYEDAFWLAYREGDFKGAALLIEPWKVALASAAGLFVTYGMMLAGAMKMVREPHPFVAALTLAPGLRALPAAWSFLSAGGGRGGTDEAHVAAITGIPEVLLVLVGLGALGSALYWTLRHRPEPGGGRFGLTVAGLACGLAVWMFVGPFLLP